MRKRIFTRLCLVLLLVCCLSLPALADTGPKPSVVVYFQGLSNETYYVTLLSATDSTGPYSHGNAYEEWMGDREAWDAFHNYQDADGFYFLGCYEDCSPSQQFRWGYYPPQRFKILLYFPEYDRLIVSADIYERYAFDSYYTADARELDILNTAVAGMEMPITRTYNRSWELLSLLCRIVATIAIELAVALLFGLRRRQQLAVIALTNLATQTLLNILLNVINYQWGAFAFIFNYVWMELLVFVLEALIYAKLLRRYAAPEQKVRPWLYAFCANLASLAIGLLIAYWLPGIF